MLAILLAFVAGTLGGTVAGGLASWWLSPRERSGRASVDHPAVDLDIDHQINQAASQWADVHHWPEAAPLVADKLRLAYTLNEQQERRRNRLWSP